MKLIPLQELLEKFKSFENSFGPEELKVLLNAELLLKGQIPMDLAGKHAYVSKSGQVQGDLNTLLARLNYILSQSELEKDKYWGKLLYDEEYEGRDRWKIALANDQRLFDMEATCRALTSARDYINDMTWSVKTVTPKL